MDPITPERWAEAEAVVDRALEVPRAERARLVREACGGDVELLRVVESWLAACENPSRFPSVPAAALGAPLLGDALEGDLPVGSEGAERAAAGGTGAAADRRGWGAPPPRIGPYRVVRELGRGGMGTVVLAERDDGQFDRRVAIKLMRRGGAADETLLRRFLEERQLLARLEHPHIATLLDGGVTEDGQPYFVMQYVRGVPIDRFCDGRRLTVEERLGVFLAVCDAVEHAHGRGVVHRDLKPGNVLVGDDGAAKLLDFGIAKLVTGDADDGAPALTRTGERLLTPEYASPEQIRGEPVTPASDVYALGVLLYELLTGRGPYARAPRTPHGLERAVLEEEPPLPSATLLRRAVSERDEAGHATAVHARATTPERLRRRLRGALDAVVLTALAKDPRRRYASAGALADDLRRHLRGEPVVARPRPRGHRARSFVNRHRAAMTTGGLGVLAGAALLAWAWLGPARPGRSAAGGSPVLAVGLVTDHSGANVSSAAALADMLATNLARTRGLQVVSAARMGEMLHRAAPGEEPAGGDRIRAGRRAGATELVEGALYASGQGTLRLDVWRVDLASGDVSAAVTATGTDLFSLTDSATVRLVTGLGLSPPPTSIADVTTRSLAAYRRYADGVSRYLAGDGPGAEAAFEDALREDSTFAMAAYFSAQMRAYNWRSASGTAAERDVLEARMARALRLADRASDRERLIVRAWYAMVHLAPETRAVAETLAVRYPHEVHGHLALGRAVAIEGDHLGAIPHLARAFEMDSSTARSTVGVCLACDALDAMTESFLLADSLAAAERHARQWLRLQPASPSARARLADVLDALGRFEETSALLGEQSGVEPRADVRVPLAKHWIRSGDLARADAELRGWIAAAEGAERARLQYLRALVLRNQGRFGAALAAGRELRALSGESVAGDAAPPSALVEAQTLFDLGRHAESEALFDSISRWQAGDGPASVGIAHRVLATTMVAASRHAAGDTTGLAALADSLQRLASGATLYRPRDQHHYVRGLLLAARGAWPEAAEAFGRALTRSATDFGRVNLELARVQLARGRPGEAVQALRPAARGGFLETTNLHVTLTEVHELLAVAWDAAGVPDSATPHWSRVARDWEQADALLGPRRSRAAERAGLLGGGNGTQAAPPPGSP